MTGLSEPPPQVGRPGGLIRIFQNVDASGASAAEEYTRDVRHEGLRSPTETVMDFFRPLSPRETDHAGVFWYTDPARGAGWLRLEQFDQQTVDEVQQAVRLLGISDSIGQREPGRQEVLSIGSSVTNRTSNPYFRMLFGGAVLALMTFAIVHIVGLGFRDAGFTVALVVSVIAAGLSVWLIITGVRRRAWWHRARAEARRQGVPLPDQLKIWD